MIQDVEEKTKDANADQAAASLVPSSTNPTPSVEGPVTYTEDQVATLVSEKHGKLDKQIAEDKKWLALATKELADSKVAKTKLAELMDTSDDALAKADGGVDVTKERAKLREMSATLTAQKESQDLEWLGRLELIEKADNMAKLVVISEAAKEHKIPVGKLMELSTETPEIIKANARVLASMQSPAAKGPVDSGTDTGKVITDRAQARKLYLAGKMTSAEFAKTRPSNFT